MTENRNVIRERIADLQFYTEGPAVDRKGNFYCTTLSGGSIMKIDQNNEVSVWAESPCPNGQIILPDGDHLVCDVKLMAIRRFSPAGKFLRNEIEGFCADIPVYTPNDLIADDEGGVYFTDSKRYDGKVCFLGSNGDQKIVADGLDYPNGLVLSLDRKSLYVAESYKNRVVRIKLRAPGLADGNIELHAKLPQNISGREQDNLPDGLALNAKGEVLVAHYGMQAIQVLSGTGETLFSIDTGMPLTSNLCFIDQQTLLVTGGFGEPGPGSIFRIRL